MSLPHGLLGLLTYGESTGYELTKIFEDSLNNFWHAQSSQIYRELDRMEGKAWVTSHNVPQEGRPNKRVYAITEAGQAALQEWLVCTPASFENPHIGFLMRMFFGGNAPEVTLGSLKICRENCLAAVQFHSKQIMENIGRYAAKVPNGEHQRLYWEMTLQYGIAQAQMVADWAGCCIEQLEAAEKKTRKQEED